MGLILFIFIVFSSLCYSNDDPISQFRRSNFEGREFYVAFMQNEFRFDPEVQPSDLSLIISSRTDAQVRIEWNGIVQNVPLTAGQSNPLLMDSRAEVTVPGYHRDKTVHITSNEAIFVSVFNSSQYTSDIYTAIPSARWGNEYRIVTMGADHYYSEADSSTNEFIGRTHRRPGEFVIIGNEDNTLVQITPTANTTQMLAGNTYDILLDKGEIFFVQGAAGEKGEQDLTGSHVRSNKPVGVISGHMRSSVLPVNDSRDGGSKDHLAEMLTPVEYWGNSFYTIPYESGIEAQNNEITSYYKIVAAYPNTVVEYSSGGLWDQVLLNRAGDHVTLDNLDGPVSWNSNQPIQLAQLMGRKYIPSESQFYDPSMVICLPTEQYANSMSFLIIPKNMFNYQTSDEPPYYQYRKHHVALIADFEAVETLTLNRVLVRNNNNFRTIPGTSKQYTYLELEPGNYTLESTSGRFSGIIYGNGNVDSYSHVLGSALYNPENEDTNYPIMYTENSCRTVVGEVYDTVGTNNSGIGFFSAVRDSTYNFNWSVGPMTDTSTYVDFYASVIDPRIDAALVIDYRDNNGLGRRFRHFYEGRRVLATDNLDLGQIVDGIPKEVIYELNNVSTSASVTLIDIRYDDEIFEIPLENELPLTMGPSTLLKSTLRFNGSANNDINEDIEFIFDCDIELETKVIADLNRPSIESTGKDFNDNYLLISECDSIEVENDGDTPIIVESISYNASVFDIDTLGCFPFELLPGEIKKFYTCFTPDERISYEEDISFNAISLSLVDSTTGEMDTLKLVSNSTLRGYGIAPQVTPLTYDWEKVRTGDTKTISLEFENTGNAPAELVFEDINIENNYQNDPVVDYLSNYSATINPRSVATIEIEFTPPEPILYNISASFTIANWNPHEIVTLSTIGEGIEPDLQTQINCFDETDVGETRIQRFNIAEAIGDLESRISNIVVLNTEIKNGNDTERTEWEIIDLEILTDLQDVYNRSYQVGTNIDLEFEWNPNSVGEYLWTFAIIHDGEAIPSTMVDTFQVCGTSVLRVFPDVTVNSDNSIIYACDSTILNYSLQNTGDVDLELIELEIVNSNVDVQILDYEMLTLPLLVSQNEILEFDLEVYLNRVSKGSFDVRSTFKDPNFDSIYVKEQSYQVEPEVLDLIVYDSVYNTEIDNQKKIFISGNIPFDIDTDLDFRIEIEVDEYYINLESDLTTITFETENDNYQVSANVRQEGNKIIVTLAEELIEIRGILNWNMELPIRSLFHRERNTEITVNVFGDECFNYGSGKVDINIEDICIFNFKQIQVSFADVNIYPNPVGDYLYIDLLIDNEDEIKITLTDMLGKSFVLDEKKLVNKGNHLLNYDLTFTNAGNYIISVEGKYFNKKTLIIKSN